MSKRVPKERYEKTRSYRFKQWLAGTKDPFLDQVEMKPQEEIHEPEKLVHEHELQHLEIVEKAYDLEHNAQIRLFQKLYNVFSVIFCLSLVFILLVGVSYLPQYGREDNPVNNEVSARYIEQGLQETGAVNIVTGMILDYRAFDTLGESHVLFLATCTVLILLRKDKKKKNEEENHE